MREDAGSLPDAGQVLQCASASVCGGRVTCGATSDCLCLGTPEGDVRCGQRPFTCHAQACDTSSDCAHLGPGFFCDQPSSGCCSDPPMQFRRCIAPCGVDTSKTWPENLGVLVEGLRTFIEGGRTSLGGDGSGDLTTTVDGGTRVTILRSGSRSKLTTISTGDRQVDTQGDLNVDGVVDLVHAESGDDSVWQASTLWDTDFNGAMDLHQTRSIDVPALTFTETIESWVDGGWVVDSSRTGPTEENQGTTCRGLDGFPTDTSGPAINPLGPRVPDLRVLYDGANEHTPGYCSFEQAVAISQAVRTAVADLKCLKNINPYLAQCVQTALAKGKLNIACGNSCTATDGASDLGGSWTHDRGRSLRMYLNPNKVGDLGSIALEQTVLHELLHFCGQSHYPDNGGGGGTDSVYSCGRHCAKCSAGSPIGPFGPADQARDCARCADSANKAKCGFATHVVESCKLNSAVCHGGAGVNAQCSQCLLSERRACDGSEVSQAYPVFVCCKECPAAAPRNTDKPCTSQAPGVTVPCGKPSTCP
ncbi:MAG: hypothetical protein AMXMBFR34_21670 [Myxococcaceae bacterium]